METFSHHNQSTVCYERPEHSELIVGEAFLIP
jgi:hypothetical protein